MSHSRSILVIWFLILASLAICTLTYFTKSALWLERFSFMVAAVAAVSGAVAMVKEQSDQKLLDNVNMLSENAETDVGVQLLNERARAQVLRTFYTERLRYTNILIIMSAVSAAFSSLSTDAFKAIMLLGDMVSGFELGDLVPGLGSPA